MRPGPTTATSPPSTTAWARAVANAGQPSPSPISILIVIYHLLKDGTVYHEFGADFFDQRQRDTVIKHSVRRLEKLAIRWC